MTATQARLLLAMKGYQELLHRERLTLEAWPGEPVGPDYRVAFLEGRTCADGVPRLWETTGRPILRCWLVLYAGQEPPDPPDLVDVGRGRARP